MAGTNGNMGPKVSPLEMESLTGTEIDSLDAQSSPDEDNEPTQPFVMPNIFNLLLNLWTLFIAHASYYRRVTFPLAAVLIILGVIGLLDAIAYSTTQRHVASVSHDYTNAHSIYELKMQQIDHWCLSGDDDSCRCDDPTIAMSKGEVKGWTRAHKKNKELVSDYDFMSSGVDVVMLGDQVTEEWNGRLFGSLADDYKGVNHFFKKTFTKSGGGNLDAVALGIAGDSITNLLWRLQHGEMPDALVPKVWWIQIGGNDLARGQCSEEATLLGILRLAEYISTNRPGSIVVINSILPSLTEVKPRIKGVKFKPFELFPSIQVVNAQLEKFCKKNKEFEFYDATNLFFTSPPAKPSSQKKNKKKQHLPSLDSQLMDEAGKLTNAGHKKWGNAIVEEVKRIMYDNIYEEQGGLMDDMFTDDYSF
eukprot:CAMPEP_0119003062 /NCGR_PEP_ID=MMETSP1176-20130426/331_1 /TAXON_ID=265551 /ORGANISM="Synedropsis recta cf, Strain CCMP1620" /LENGTH=418 /DNA_ID=CAMNT_0006954621 /DNA_START=28 /DNA_END=1284 /DNA_ORIENTATION=-